MLTIDMHHISKVYLLGERVFQILHEIEFKVHSGELLAIMGASGSGKSTLMNIIGLLDHQSTGSYLLNGRDVSHLSDDERAHIRNQTMGFVFQQFFLLPRLTALQNVALPLQYAKHKMNHATDLCFEALSKVGMAEHVHKRPMQLSGGQQQRVAIARALIMKPSVILADEPTGALDSKIGQEVMDLFLHLNRVEKTTIVIVTHDDNVAKQTDRVVHVRDGHVVD